MAFSNEQPSACNLWAYRCQLILACRCLGGKANCRLGVRQQLAHAAHQQHVLVCQGLALLHRRELGVLVGVCRSLRSILRRALGGILRLALGGILLAALGGILRSGALGGILRSGALGGIHSGALAGILRSGALAGILRSGALAGILRGGALGGILPGGALGGILPGGALGGILRWALAGICSRPLLQTLASLLLCRRRGRGNCPPVRLHVHQKVPLHAVLGRTLRLCLQAWHWQ